MITTKVCLKCNIEFEYKRTNKLSHRSYCKKCHTIYMRNYRKVKKDYTYENYSNETKKELERRKNFTTSEKQKDSSLKRLYKINLTEYNLKLVEQNHSCGICKRHQNTLNVSLAVDHNHINNKIRGLLCHNCNRALGLLNIDNCEENGQNLLNYIKNE